MGIKRLISEENKKQIRDTALIRQKKRADLTQDDINKLVIVMAAKLGLRIKEI